MLVLFRVLAVPETVQMKPLQARPANPVEPCGSSTILSHDPTVAADRNDTVGEIALTGACSGKTVRGMNAYSVQSVLARHWARTVAARRMTSLPTTGRLDVPIKVTISCVVELQTQVAVADPANKRILEQSKEKADETRVSARFVAALKVSTILLPSSENVADSGTGTEGATRKLRTVTVVLKLVYRSVRLVAAPVTT